MPATQIKGNHNLNLQPSTMSIVIDLTGPNFIDLTLDDEEMEVEQPEPLQVLPQVVHLQCVPDAPKTRELYPLAMEQDVMDVEQPEPPHGVVLAKALRRSARLEKKNTSD